MKDKEFVEKTINESTSFFIKIINSDASPQVNSSASKFCSKILGNHIISLLESIALLNQEGRHSSAVALFRSIEDAQDCFGAVSLIAGSAEKWISGKLKASDAAKLLNEYFRFTLPESKEKLDEYRKIIRNFFNKVAHCSPMLVGWDLIENEGSSGNSEFLFNKNGIILPNYLKINTYFIISIYELLMYTQNAYESYLNSINSGTELNDLIDSMNQIINDPSVCLFEGEFYEPISFNYENLIRNYTPSEYEMIKGKWKCFWDCNNSKKEGILKLNQSDCFINGYLEVKDCVEGIYYTVKEKMAGIIYNNIVLLDGIESSVSPTNNKLIFTLDNFQLQFLKKDNEMVGQHKCSNGSGSARFNLVQ
jgi:hypothetical protein